MFQGQDARGRDDMDIDFPLDPVQGIPVKPSEIRLVHGEEPAKAALTEQLRDLGYNVT